MFRLALSQLEIRHVRPGRRPYWRRYRAIQCAPMQMRASHGANFAIIRSVARQDKDHLFKFKVWISIATMSSGMLVCYMRELGASCERLITHGALFTASGLNFLQHQVTIIAGIIFTEHDT